MNERDKQNEQETMEDRHIQEWVNDPYRSVWELDSDIVELYATEGKDAAMLAKRRILCRAYKTVGYYNTQWQVYVVFILWGVMSFLLGAAYG